MATYPTQDLKLQIDLGQLICKECSNWSCTNNPNIPTHKFFDFVNLCEVGNKTLKAQLNIIEKRGYHIGLPESIEHALNSGDGTYRP